MNNCNNCHYIEWGFGDVNDPEGYLCNKREYKSDTVELRHILKLSIKEYRIRPKKCFLLKNAGVEVVE